MSTLETQVPRTRRPAPTRPAPVGPPIAPVCPGSAPSDRSRISSRAGR